MKILAAGCLHNDRDFIYELAYKAEENDVDLVVLCGDLTHSEQSTENIIGPFINKNRRVAIIGGNHESEATINFLAEKYNLINIHNDAHQEGNIGFFGAGGANCGIFGLDEQEIYNRLTKNHEKIKNSNIKIMVTHNHPAETKMEKLSDFVTGSKGITKAIKKLKPDILLCSHLHEGSGIEEKLNNTKIINVSRTAKIIQL